MLHPDYVLKMIKEFRLEPEIETVHLADALGRVLAEDQLSPMDSPPFDKAAMDGFAVRSDDRSHTLRVLETIAAGDSPRVEIKEGTCSKIMTGAMIPPGADKVVRVEYTDAQFTRETGDQVSFLQEEPLVNVIKRGENLGIGEVFLKPGRLRAQDIGLLASFGVVEVKVAVPPLVGIIITGSELGDPGRALDPGQIYNSNGPQLCAQIQALACPYRYYGIVPDDPPRLGAAIEQALEECGLVLLSGGVSMGAYDFVPAILEQKGVDIHVHKLAVKPGKPTLFGQRKQTYVFGLPGNPVSSFVIFEVLVRPLLYRLMGLHYEPLLFKGRLVEDFRRRSAERVEYRPIRLSGGRIQIISYHGSAHLDALSRANGLIRIEQGVTILEKGTEIDVRQI